MKKGLTVIPLLLIATVLLITIVFVKCTKKETMAAALDRSVAASSIDSTLFSPFYDSTLVPYADVTPEANDYIVKTGILSIIKSNCGSADCHGGNISPTLNSYAAIKSLVVAGSPESSKLWQLLTTNDLNKAMPPVNLGKELTLAEKNEVYNWILNGAKQAPDIADYRPSAIRLITGGCTSGNCHSEAQAVGYWAKSGWITFSPSDTSTLAITNLTTGAISYTTQMTNTTLLNSVWQAYKDSCRKFFADTVANASYRPWKYFGGRGPLNTYDDIILDANYPKNVRSSAKAYKVNGVYINCKGDYLNSTASILYEIDSTIFMYNPRTMAKIFNSHAGTYTNGGMAFSDGGLATSDIGIIKAWWFSDPNIPDTWKFGINNVGIYQYDKTGSFITKH